MEIFVALNDWGIPAILLKAEDEHGPVLIEIGEVGSEKVKGLIRILKDMNKIENTANTNIH